MSDARLRALERAWRDSRTVEDEARLLQARVQHGLVPRVRVWFAARSGLDSARQVYGPLTSWTQDWRSDGDVARHLEADLPEEVAEEIRQHMAWVERKAAKRGAAPGKVKRAAKPRTPAAKKAPGRPR